MRDYKSLKVWQDAHELVKDVYKLCAHFPKSEIYGITSQLKRATVSIPTNIAEGCGRFSHKEFSRFLVIASGSASEVEYLLLLSYELKFLQQSDYVPINEKVVGIKKMLTALKNRFV